MNQISWFDALCDWIGGEDTPHQPQPPSPQFYFYWRGCHFPVDFEGKSAKAIKKPQPIGMGHKVYFEPLTTEQKLEVVKDAPEGSNAAIAVLYGYSKRNEDDQENEAVIRFDYSHIVTS